MSNVPPVQHPAPQTLHLTLVHRLRVRLRVELDELRRDGANRLEQRHQIGPGRRDIGRVEIQDTRNLVAMTSREIADQRTTP